MAEEWSELIWIGLALMLFASVLAIAFNFMQLGKGLTNELYQDQADAAAIKEMQLFLPYENAELTGSEALAASLTMANNGYPAFIYFNQTKKGSSYRTVMVYEAGKDAQTIATSLYNTCTNKSSVSTNFSQQLSCIKNNDGDCTAISNTEYTTVALLEYLDSLAKVYNTATKSFSEWKFKSYVLYDAQDKPLGLLLGYN